jgi:hypothetical protein
MDSCFRLRLKPRTFEFSTKLIFNPPNKTKKRRRGGRRAMQGALVAWYQSVQTRLSPAHRCHEFWKSEFFLLPLDLPIHPVSGPSPWNEWGHVRLRSGSWSLQVCAETWTHLRDGAFDCAKKWWQAWVNHLCKWLPMAEMLPNQKLEISSGSILLSDPQKCECT